MTTTFVSIASASCPVREKFLSLAAAEALRDQKGETESHSVAELMDTVWSIMNGTVAHEAYAGSVRRRRKKVVPVVA